MRSQRLAYGALMNCTGQCLISSISFSQAISANACPAIQMNTSTPFEHSNLKATAIEVTLAAFEASLHRIVNTVTTRSHLDEGNGAYPFLEVATSSSTLDQQYANGLKAHGISNSDCLRLVKLHQSLKNAPEAKEAVRRTLDNKIAKISI